MARISSMDKMLTSVLVMGLVFLVVADAKRDIPTECPKKNLPNVTVQIADDTDCTKYYLCAGGKKISKECPVMDKDGNRLYFNPELQVCDWPRNVDCKSPPPGLVTLSSTQNIKYPTECPRIDPKDETIVLPYEYDCTKYYMCSGGKKYLMECGPSDNKGGRLYFNRVKHVCDWPFNVDCKWGQPSVRVATFAEILPVPTECPEHESMNFTVHLPDETDCTKFFKCSFGEKIPQDCPPMANGEKLRYNKYLQVCDWPWNVDCPPNCSTTTTELPTTRPTPHPTTRPTRRPTTRPTPHPTTRPTPHPTTGPTTPPAPPTPTPDPGVEGCIGSCPSGDSPNKITPYPHEYCRKWCTCENEVMKVWICPANFYYSPTIEKCTEPEHAGCEGIKDFKKSRALKDHDEAIMNVFGYNERFLW